MNLQDVQRFVTGVRDATKNLPTESVEKAIIDFIFRGRFQGSDMPACVEAARQLATENREPVQRREHPGAASPYAALAEVELASDLLVRFLEPEAQKAREKIFGNPEVPFRGRGARQRAVDWIRAEAAKRRQPSQRGQKRLSEILLEIRELMREYCEIQGLVAGLNLDGPILEYAGPTDTAVRKAGVPLSSPLLEVKRFADQAARETGFKEYELVDYLLTGTRPYLPRFDFRDHRFFGRARLRPPEYTITVRGYNVTKETFYAAYRQVQATRAHSPNPVDLQDLAVFRAVDQIEKKPDETQAEYWKRVQVNADKELKVWRAKALTGKGKVGEAARVRYHRLPDKLMAVPDGLKRTLLAL